METKRTRENERERKPTNNKQTKTICNPIYPMHKIILINDSDIMCHIINILHGCESKVKECYYARITKPKQTNFVCQMYIEHIICTNNYYNWICCIKMVKHKSLALPWHTHESQINVADFFSPFYRFHFFSLWNVLALIVWLNVLPQSYIDINYARKYTRAHSPTALQALFTTEAR